MGPSQGSHGNVLALKILARLRGEDLDGKQTTTARPFVSSLPMGILAGRTFTPRRRTPMHAWHEERNAKLMYAGDWFRPEYYVVESKPREKCIRDEAINVRKNIGLIDLGTLGKIEISGADAVAFIESLYTGLFTKLKVGMSRYGVACDETGVVIDDGVVARLAEDRFYVSTTTSGSDAVYREMQRWALIRGLDVVLVNATSAYGAMNLAGPKSQELLQPLTDIDLSREAFPYMGVREGVVAGVPARLTRVGFVGELGYEVHVPYERSLQVWTALMTAGEEHGIAPFGVEAQRLLRLEKGHIIVSQDTDGLTQPYEANLGWALKMKKAFFVGQRTLEVMKSKELRRELVGFKLPAESPLPKECHLVLDGPDIAGRVTSIADSPALGHPIGLAYVKPAQSEPGTKIRIRIDDGQEIEAEVVKIPFYDPEGERQK
jgi:sarcosine oxidase subunit alpha